MDGVLGHAFQCLDDQCFDARMPDRARRSGTRCIAKPVDPMLDEPSTPLADRILSISSRVATSRFSPPCAEAKTIRPQRQSLPRFTA
jgi:hypothetical protein